MIFLLHFCYKLDRARQAKGREGVRLDERKKISLCSLASLVWLEYCDSTLTPQILIPKSHGSRSTAYAASLPSPALKLSPTRYSYSSAHHSCPSSPANLLSSNCRHYCSSPRVSHCSASVPKSCLLQNSDSAATRDYYARSSLATPRVSSNSADLDRRHVLVCGYSRFGRLLLP